MAILKRECPREDYLKRNLSFGTTKYSALRSIMQRVIMKLDAASATDADADRFVCDEFAAIPVNTMLPFEMEEEAKRMAFLIRRFLNWERKQAPSSRILAKEFSSQITFAGQKKTQRVHWLADRGSHLEAIRFSYKQPEYSSRGRTFAAKPAGSPYLLMLQYAGEIEAAKLGIDIRKKPVFGAIYYLKSRGDTAKAFEPAFDNRPERNIIAFRFSDSDAQKVEDAYTREAPDLNSVCDKDDCADCLYFDLCHTEFEKRHKMDQPPAALKTIDSITLTDAQMSFIAFREGECRVNAVAGSGKTTIVTLRTLGMIEEGTDPSHILMVTFSEKAKNEMYVRLRSFAKGKMLEGTDLDVDKVQAETFNSWGQHVLNDNYALLGFTCQPSLVDDIAKKDIIIELLGKHRTLPLDYRNPFMDTRAAEGAVAKLGKWIDTMKAAHVETEADAANALGISRPALAAELLEVYQEYNQALLAINAIDYEDQLRLLLKLADYGVFEKMPYEHIVVDEFQDSNPNQIAIIVELKRRNPGIKSMVVVGDELQAIYGFRNASPDNLVSFGDYFPQMMDIDMTANFRSQAPIIQMANQIIRKSAKLGKAIEAHRKTSNVQPAVLEFQTEEQERDLFMRQIKKLIRNGTKPGSIAVLCRTRNELIKQQMLLEKEGIPTILKVPEIVAEAPYVKAVIALASYIMDNNDTASLALYAKSLGQNPFDENLLKESGEAIKKIFENCTTEAEKIEAFMTLIQDAGDDYVADEFIEKMKRRNYQTLSQHLSYCTKYRDYKVRDTQSTAQEKTDCVTLITVHSAKGLEWDVVLLSLKRFPVDEESKRLFYVGVTRAREKLLLSYTAKQAVLASLIDDSVSMR